ncbi:hypothetical protein I4F81_010123 [Pyropia yezoensis]|uniref:Uncharacterized protein n=1 Tax=Pyropia yezoensis TaxID=2788 RepID=A0ACC3CBS8_PYRYE|nr:hypothetical protein I4F81_010123 [Neopyropia yezoensis]|eukprot:contig_14817_g3556
MHWILLLSLGVMASLAAPSVGASVNSGDLPDLPPTFRDRLSTLLDLEAGPLAGAGGGSVEKALRAARAVSGDADAPKKKRVAASKALVEALRLVRGLEQARRCHRFYHENEPASQWGLCCSLTGRGPGAATIGGRSRLCLAMSTVGIPAPGSAPVHGRHFLRIKNTRPLRARNADGAVMVYEDDPKALLLKGKGWARTRRGARRPRSQSRPASTAAPVDNDGSAHSRARSPPAAVRVAEDAATEDVTILPIGESWEDEYLEYDAGAPSAAFACQKNLNSDEMCIYFCCNTMWVSTALCADLKCF